jgi:hypothetical protein
MRKITLFALALVFGLLCSAAIAFAQHDLTPAEAATTGDRYATVCGKVVQTVYMPELTYKPTFLYVDKPFPNQTFEIVIWGSDRNRFLLTPELMFTGKDVCVQGALVKLFGIPQIVVAQPAQINVVKSEG